MQKLLVYAQACRRRAGGGKRLFIGEPLGAWAVSYVVERRIAEELVLRSLEGDAHVSGAYAAAVERHLAGIRRKNACEHPGERGLTRTGGARNQYQSLKIPRHRPQSA